MTKILAAMTAALMLAACATTAAAPTVQIAVGAARPETGMVTGTAFDITVTNTGQRTAKRVVVGCQFFDAADTLVNTGTTFFNNLAAGGSDTNGLLSMTSGVTRAVCIEAAPAKGALR